MTNQASHRFFLTTLAILIATGAACAWAVEDHEGAASIPWVSKPVGGQVERRLEIEPISKPVVQPARSNQSDPDLAQAVIAPADYRAARAAMAEKKRLEELAAESEATPAEPTNPNPAPVFVPAELEQPTEALVPPSTEETKLDPVSMHLLQQTRFDWPADESSDDSQPTESERPPLVETPATFEQPVPPTQQDSADNDFPTPLRFASARATQPAAAKEPSGTGKSLPKLPNTKPTAASGNKKSPGVLAHADSFVLAEQPKQGDHWRDETPQVDCRAWDSETYLSDFTPDATAPNLPYDPCEQMQVYEGKTLNSNQRPILELGRPWYQLGQLSPGSSILGHHNNLTPQFLLYGDIRSAIASNNLGNDTTTRTAAEANLDFDLKLTATERFHWFMSPLDDGANNSGYLFDEDRFDGRFDADLDFGYFEGDLGAMVGGAIGKTLPFDAPFAIGVMPLLFQNGVWMEDAFLGFAATIPARNSPRFDISNMDFTFFAGYDKINSDAFPGDDSAARMYGMASFIEATNGYWEIDYAFLDDRTFDDRSYHNIGIGFTRRYGRLISNSTRIIVNAGQSSDSVENTADGVLLLSENSLITGAPSTLVPYLNLFAGFDRPQSAARAAAAGGVLRNTGILFESDGMTGYPTLDPTANDTFGMALGLNLIADDFSQQLVVEAAMLGVMGEDRNRNAAGDQYGLGVRYQLPLTNAIIFRTDAMVGFRRNDEDINGVRMEFRHKF